MPRLKLHWWILIGMLLGAASGFVVQQTVPAEQVADSAIYHAFDGVASIFLRLLKLIVVPLVFFSLLGGMIGLGDLTQLGRMGAKTFGLYITTSLIAIVTGLVLVNLIQPGAGVNLPIPTKAVEREIPESAWDVLVNMVPDNIVGAAARLELIGVIFFAVLFGSFLITLQGERRKVLVTFVEAVAEVMMRITAFIVSLAPVGIAALIARMVSVTGIAIFWDLRWYVITVTLALAVHALISLPLLSYIVRRKNPYRYLRAMSPALLTGFSTASSSGTLGVTLERAEHGGGVSNRVASFVLPLGATVNMDGTALYEIVTVLFIAQVHAGVDPSFSVTLGQQLLIVVLGLLVSIGAAGIPHAGLVMMVIILQAVGLPTEYTALIWAVDRVLDMCRTSVNIASDSTVCLLVAHSEGEIDESVLWGDKA